MKNSDLEKEILKINSRLDKLFDVISMERNAKTCVSVSSPTQDMMIGKIYDIVKRMKFDNDRQMWDRRAAEVDEKIKDLEKNREYIKYEKQEIERQYYNEN